MDELLIEPEPTERELGTAPIKPLFARYAAITFAGMLAQMVMVVLEGLIIGNGLGPLGLAAVTVILPLELLNLALGGALGMGTAAAAGQQAQGQRQGQEQGKHSFHVDTSETYLGGWVPFISKWIRKESRARSRMTAPSTRSSLRSRTKTVLRISAAILNSRLRARPFGQGELNVAGGAGEQAFQVTAEGA